jgi:glycosyltransferase involved in cell wall biosynthesis
MNSICIDCRYAGATPSGIGEFVRGLLQHVPRLAPDLRFVLLRNPQTPARLSECPNVSEVSTPTPVNGPGSMWFLPDLVDLREVGLFHATANFLPARLPMRTLTTVHDIMWLTHPQWCNPAPYGRIERLFYGHGIRRAINRSTRIAALSAATRDAITARAPQAAERISVIHSGVAERFHPVPVDRTALARLGLGPESGPARRFVLTVGQYAPYKNHEGALDGFARAFGASDDIALVFVQRQARGGDGLRRMAARLGIADRAIFLRAVAPADLLQLYSAAEVLLHPSLAEGFGNPVAEAMACGCPVITSDRSAMPEVAGGAALLVDPLDSAGIAAALGRVVGNNATRRTLSEAGLARARSLDWESAARRYVGLYREILAAA